MTLVHDMEALTMNVMMPAKTTDQPLSFTLYSGMFLPFLGERQGQGPTAARQRRPS